MKNAVALFVVPVLVPLLALAMSACSGSSGGGAVTCSGATLTAKPANNYAFSSTLTFEPISVQPKTELTFDWGSVTSSFLGHPVNPKTDLKMISILMWDLTLADLQSKLNADTLLQKDLVVVPLTYPTDGSNTTAKLFSFTLNGGAVDSATIMSYFDDTTYPYSDPAATHPHNIYTVMASKETTPGQGVQMIQSFKLDPASTNTTVKMTNSSTALQYTANLHNLTPTGIPAAQAAITLDWGSMTTNALGQPFDPTQITRALVGHYTQSPTEIEKQFLDIETIATDLYLADISIGTMVDFSTMKTIGGKTFPGIDATGTWVVALQCGACRNPAPWYLTVLKPCS